MAWRGSVSPFGRNTAYHLQHHDVRVALVADHSDVAGPQVARRMSRAALEIARSDAGTLGGATATQAWARPILTRCGVMTHQGHRDEPLSGMRHFAGLTL